MEACVINYNEIVDNNEKQRRGVHDYALPSPVPPPGDGMGQRCIKDRRTYQQ
jgi:hypothetical protein